MEAVMLNRRALAAGLAVGTLAVVLALIWWPERSAPGPAICEAPGKAADLDLTLKDRDGKDVRLADHRGKVLVLDFWATWCGPCKVEIPGFVSLYDKYRKDGLEIFGLVTLDEMKNVPPFATEFKMNYPILDANENPDVEKAYGPFEGLPTTLVIDRDGRVCKEHFGYTPVEEFEREIQALL
jgi:peroxiredoxin